MHVYEFDNNHNGENIKIMGVWRASVCTFDVVAVLAYTIVMSEIAKKK